MLAEAFGAAGCGGGATPAARPDRDRPASAFVASAFVAIIIIIVAGAPPAPPMKSSPKNSSNRLPRPPKRDSSGELNRCCRTSSRYSCSLISTVRRWPSAET
jgi:hypothetical protein